MAWLLACLRSIVHMVLMLVTVVPYAFAILLASLAGFSGVKLYRIAAQWLQLSVHGARWILGIQYRIHGQENLPLGEQSPAVLLVKHQSTYETFLMPVIMPHPLAYVFKKELLRVPFFGWAMGRLDMIHIDRSQRAQAFNKVVAQGRELLERGVWVIMFPEGTRIDRGERGVYKSGGTRLAVETGAPVIPIAVTSARCWPRKALIKHAGVVDVSIGAPIDSRGQDPEVLMRQVEDWIEAEMRRLDPEAYTQE